MSWWRAIIAATLALPLLIILANGFGTDPRAVPSMLEGKAAPPFKLPKLDGGQLASDELKGRPVLLNFWATWCEPCKVEHEVLQRAAARYDNRVTFVGVIHQDTAKKAKAYLARRNNRYLQLVDEDGVMGVDFGVAGVPETFFITSTGTISHKRVGPLSALDANAALARLVAQEAAP